MFWITSLRRRYEHGKKAKRQSCAESLYDSVANILIVGGLHRANRRGWPNIGILWNTETIIEFVFTISFIISNIFEITGKPLEDISTNSLKVKFVQQNVMAFYIGGRLSKALLNL